jgi:ABC-type dipeptide/oligopeptide/nickel transport system permease subunit
MPGDKKFFTLLTAAIFWAIWNTRKKISFEGFVLKSPVSVIFIVCSFLNYWAGLYSEEEGMKIKMGPKQLIDKATDMAKVFLGTDDAGCKSICSSQTSFRVSVSVIKFVPRSEYSISSICQVF